MHASLFCSIYEKFHGAIGLIRQKFGTVAWFVGHVAKLGIGLISSCIRTITIFLIFYFGDAILHSKCFTFIVSIC